MKLSHSLSILAVSCLLSSGAFAQSSAMNCSLASSGHSPNSSFSISSDAVGSKVSIAHETYRIVASQSGYQDDIYGEQLSLENLATSSAARLEIFCF
jgi:hypothetical protein